MGVVRLTGFDETDLGSIQSLLFLGGSITLGRLVNLPHLIFFTCKTGVKSLPNRFVVRI